MKCFLMTCKQIDIMGKISDAEVVGNQLKSQKLTYVPKDIKSGENKEVYMS